MKLFYVFLALQSTISYIDSDLIIDPDIKKLLIRNQGQSAKNQDIYKDYYTQLTEKQSPKFLWISCSDSRVSEANIFDTQPGEIFVHRNIGSLVQKDDVSIKSVIEYAVMELKVKHIIITGHYKCGGVKAAMEDKLDLKYIESWVKPLHMLYKRHQAELKAMDANSAWDTFVRYSIGMSAQNLLELDIVNQAVTNHQLEIHTWVYNITSGLIDILNTSKAVTKTNSREPTKIIGFKKCQKL